MRQPISTADYRHLAEKRLPRMVFDYLEGGADDDAGVAENIQALARIKFLPRRLVDVSRRAYSTTLFGKSLSLPLVIGPTGLNGLFRTDGDLILARAAGRAGIPFALSTASSNSIEEVAQHGAGELWFQLYVMHRQFAQGLVERARIAGFSTLILTVDLPVNGNRERDLRNGFGGRVRYTPRTLWDGATHPSWALAFMSKGAPRLANLTSATDASPEVQAALISRRMDATFNWDDLRTLRDSWPGRLLVKGILAADDAQKCIEHGADGVILSNHGGRQLAQSVTALEQLPRVTRAVKAPILVDGGFRRGSDVVKALALGANAVLLGRAPLYALAARGESGVDHLLQLIREDIDRTLALIGCPSCEALSPAFISNPADAA